MFAVLPLLCLRAQWITSKCRRIGQRWCQWVLEDMTRTQINVLVCKLFDGSAVHTFILIDVEALLVKLKLNSSWQQHAHFLCHRRGLYPSVLRLHRVEVNNRWIFPKIILCMCDCIVTVISTMFQSCSNRPAMWLADNHRYSHIYRGSSYILSPPSRFHIALLHIQYVNKNGRCTWMST